MYTDNLFTLLSLKQKLIITYLNKLVDTKEINQLESSLIKITADLVRVQKCRQKLYKNEIDSICRYLLSTQ